MEKLTVEYCGAQDNPKVMDFFKKINNTVKKVNLPTNLYTHTNSPIDIVIIDFDHFDLNDFAVNEADLCIAVIYNKYKKISNHMILKPSTLMSIEFNILPTAGDDPYDHLALSLRVNKIE